MQRDEHEMCVEITNCGLEGACGREEHRGPCVAGIVQFMSSDVGTVKLNCEISDTIAGYTTKEGGFSRFAR